MDRTIRRALYTALVAAGLMVVAASAAHAAEALPDPAAQGATTDTTEGSVAARDDLGAVLETHEPEAGAAGESGVPAGAQAGDGLTGAVDGAAGAPGAEGLVGDIVGPEGILGSLTEGDVGGVVEGALGEGGLVDDLLGGLPPTEVPGPEEPGTGGPGTGEPGTDEPGTGEPGTGEPGTGEPGTGEPGTDEPGTGEPGTDKPGTSKPGTDDSPGPAAVPFRPDTLPGSGSATVGLAPGHGGEYWAETPTGVSLTGAFPGGRGADAGDARDLGAMEDGEPGTGPDTDRDLPDGGVDISWGDRAGAVPAEEHDGAIRTGGLRAGLAGRVPGSETTPEGEAEATSVVVPGAAYAPTGHMFTGQLSLISLLLGLGIATLRTRRR